MNRVTKARLFTIFRYAMLVVWSVIVAFPIFWIVSTSFKPDWEWHAWPPVYWSTGSLLGQLSGGLGQAARVPEPPPEEKVATETARYESALGQQALAGALEQPLYRHHRHRAFGRLRRNPGLRGLAIPDTVGDTDVPAPCAQDDSAHCGGGAADALLLGDPSDGHGAGADYRLFHYDIAVFRLDDEELRGRGSRRDRTGRRDSGRDQVAGHPRGDFPAHPLRA